ncbi:MAG TPA: DVUA0089 family protein [Phycisphaerales bacterium]|nr:DVUA0089 family protein [Phycisphaerales bacterium]
MRLAPFVLGLLATASVHAGASYTGTINWLSGEAPGNPRGSGATTTSVDHIRFVVHTEADITFDVLSAEVNDDNQPVDLNGDGRIAFIDSMIMLFQGDGHLDVHDYIDASDDYGDADDNGSLYPMDSYMTLHLMPGQYVLAISSFFLTPEDAVNGINTHSDGPFTVDSRGDFFIERSGDYRVDIIGDADIMLPTPGTVALPAMALVGFARRRRTRE